jgi:hypothetical protein
MTYLSKKISAGLSMADGVSVGLTLDQALAGNASKGYFL